MLSDHFLTKERFLMTSRRPYWCSKPVLWELNSFLMETLSFVSINLHRCWSREWKRSIVGCCCMLLRKVWNRSNFSANNSQHFFCSVIAEAWRNNVGSVCTALPTLLGPRTLITQELRRLMGCILPTMHWRSQTCWELLHPFAHHCQDARNNSQHCWRNNVGSCCACLQAA